MGMWACVWKWVCPPTHQAPPREDLGGKEAGGVGWRRQEVGAEPGGPEPQVPVLWALLWQQGFLISSQTLTIPVSGVVE